jgi:hypothetical protein
VITIVCAFKKTRVGFPLFLLKKESKIMYVIAFFKSGSFGSGFFKSGSFGFAFFKSEKRPLFFEVLQKEIHVLSENTDRVGNPT